jgi:guanylate kinase
MNDHKLFALIGVAASGKTDLARHICDKFGISYIPSITSRPVRPGNENEYKHLTKEEFEQYINNDEVLEYTIFNGNYYGKLKSDVFDCLEGNNCVYTITADRAKELKKLIPNTILICVTPQEPVLETIEHRMHGRGVHHPEEVKSKLQTAREELDIIDGLKKNGLIDFFVTTIDKDHESAKNEIDKIVEEKINF